jgi:hypothetical protein
MSETAEYGQANTDLCVVKKTAMGEAVAAERERCAVVAEEAAAKWFAEYQRATHPARQGNAMAKLKACTEVAAAIRSDA